MTLHTSLGVYSSKAAMRSGKMHYFGSHKKTGHLQVTLGQMNNQGWLSHTDYGVFFYRASCKRFATTTLTVQPSYSITEEHR